MPRAVANEDVGNVDPWVYNAVEGQTDIAMPVAMKILYNEQTLSGTFWHTWRHKVVRGLRTDGKEDMIWLPCRDDDDECYGCVQAKTDSHVEPSEPGNARVARIVVALAILASRGPREKSFHPVGSCGIYRFGGKKKRNQLQPILERAAANKKPLVFAIKGDGGEFKDVTITEIPLADEAYAALVAQVQDSVKESLLELRKSGEFERMIVPGSNAEIQAQINRFLRSEDHPIGDSGMDQLPPGDDPFTIETQKLSNAAADMAKNAAVLPAQAPGVESSPFHEDTPAAAPAAAPKPPAPPAVDGAVDPFGIS